MMTQRLIRARDTQLTGTEPAWQAQGSEFNSWYKKKFNKDANSEIS